MIKKALKYLAWLWKHSIGVRGQFVWNIILGILNVAANMAFILVCKRIVDIATGAAEGDFVTFALIALGILIARLVFSAVSTRITSVASSKLNFKIRSELYSNVLYSRWYGMEKRHSGDVINRLETDVTKITDTICQELPEIVTTSVQLVAAVALLCTMDWRLAALLVLITPLFMLFARVFASRMRRMTRDIRESESKVQSHLQESLRHRLVIRSMETEEMMQQKLDTLQGTELGQVVERANFNVLARALVSASFMGGYLAAFLWGAWGIAHRGISFGVMTSFLQLVGQIQRPVVNLLHQIPSLLYASASIDRLMELEDYPREVKQGSRFMEGPLGVKISSISYRYPDGRRDILRDFSFDFKPLGKTAVIGETGAGKSTLIRLILALLSPQEGSIGIYNEAGETEPVSPDTRCNFVYVPQGNSLMSGTIRENLLLGKPDATQEQMYRALESAAADFVKDLPEGLDALCGEGGAGLSEGQAQRIAIARGLLRPGSILLLDEFSSSLDPETEERLMQGLDAKAAGKTIIIITHREKIAACCDAYCRIQRN